jgi:hypothetical protein
MKKLLSFAGEVIVIYIFKLLKTYKYLWEK